MPRPHLQIRCVEDVPLGDVPQLGSGGDVDGNEGGRIRINGAEFAAVEVGEAIAGAGTKGPGHIQLGVGAKQDAVGVEQKQVGGSIYPQGAEDIGDIAPGDAGDDVVDAVGVGEVDPLAVSDVEVDEAMEDVAAPQGSPFYQISRAALDDRARVDDGAFGPEGGVGGDLGQGGSGADEGDRPGDAQGTGEVGLNTARDKGAAHS